MKIIKDKRLLSVAIVLFVTFVVFNFPFPHNVPYGEVLLSKLDLPVRWGGLHIAGIIALLLLIASLSFLVKALHKYQIRFVALAVITALAVPHYIVDIFQKNATSGIYAISYDSAQSTCRFEKADENILQGKCELPFENFSEEDVQFTIEFYNPYELDDTENMIMLMNSNAPYKANLKGRESKTVNIEAKIDQSKMKTQVESGEANAVGIIIKSGGNSRRL